MKSNTLQSILLSTLTGLGLYVAWPTVNASFLLFFSYIPLLFLEDRTSNQAKSTLSLIFYCYLSFFIWNALTTWWVWNASPGGSVAAITLNTLLMTIPFMGFHFIKQKLGRITGYLSLIVFWLTFEYIHLKWELTWPWLTLGNGFSQSIHWIQWYEYTGHLGGSLWVLLANVLFFHWIKYIIQAYQKNTLNVRFVIRKSILPIACITIPIIFSNILFKGYQEIEDPVEVLIVQPNIDPYTEKFSGLSDLEQMQKMIRLTNQKITPNTQYIVYPETAIPNGYWEDNLKKVSPITMLYAMLQKYPKASLITGISTYRKYDTKATETARKFSNGEGYYDGFNTAIQLNKNLDIPLYHKSKLVPGVERMPYPGLFGFLNHFAIDLGGIVGSLGVQKERVTFTSSNSTASVGPVICYESVFGEFVGDYVLKGSNILFIITNDAWWGNTEGHRQHCSYASIRAIEHRRSFARSANTGISCFINQKGEIQQATQYAEDAAILQNINLNNHQTFYTKHGDYIGRLACFISVLTIIYHFVQNIIRKKK